MALGVIHCSELRLLTPNTHPKGYRGEERERKNTLERETEMEKDRGMEKEMKERWKKTER